MSYYRLVSRRFSVRTSWDTTESSYAAAVREVRTQAAAARRPIYDLTISNPTRCGFIYSDDLLDPLADLRALIYDPDPRGLLSAREAVAAYYADHAAAIDPASLILTTSTSESYSYLFKLLCDPGDEVLVAQPGYPLFEFLADVESVTLRSYPLFYDHGWWIDFAELERRIGPRTRAILVVHPNNPTGHWTGQIEREALEAVCARHGLSLIVDEVFLDYPLRDSAPPRSFAAGDHPVLTFVLSGLSKVAGLPQMKAAWLLACGPESVRAQALDRLEVIADTFLSMNAPVQLAMPAWLAGRGAIQSQIRERTRANLAVLEGYPGGGVAVLQGDAGWSTVLRLSPCAGDPLCADWLLREAGVLVHPGSFYGMGEANRVVVSLIGPTQEMAAALDKIGQVMISTEILN